MLIGAIGEAAEIVVIIEAREHLIDVGEILLQGNVVLVWPDRIRIPAAKEDHRRPHGGTFENARRNLPHIEGLLERREIVGNIGIERWPTVLLFKLAAFLCDRSIEIESIAAALAAKHRSA